MARKHRDVVLIRISFIALIAILTALLRPFGISPLPGAVCGLGAGICITVVEIRLRRASLNSVVSGGAGMLAGIAFGLAFVCVLDQSGRQAGATAQFFRLAVPVVMGYLGLVLGIARSDMIGSRLLGRAAADRDPCSDAKILDTSVLIDGRISDIAEAGFLDGKLVVPQFVLNELQFVADSPDSARRNRGRRGLDLVQRLQKMPRIHVEIVTHDFPALREVDLKLIELAKSHKSKIVTNDFNLNKLAQVQGVEVLNINELANALKPVVLPGEAMRVFISKEGKEHNQGVAYLDDGTMVVVDHAKRHVSKTVEITVTSVLQTTAGKMIFGKYDERLQNAGDHRSGAANLSIGPSSDTSSAVARGGS